MGGFVDDLGTDTTARGVELESNALLMRLAYSLYAPADDSFGLEGYLLLGAADVELDGVVSDPADTPEVFNVDGDFGVVFGGGLRSRLFTRDQFTVFADGSVRFSAHDSNITPVGNLGLDFDPATESVAQDFDTKVLAWQISAYATYEVDAGATTLLPYAGIRLSGVDVEVTGTQAFFIPLFDGRQTIDYDANQDDVFGLFAGIEAGFTENFSAYFEVRVIDEFAVALGGSFRF